MKQQVNERSLIGLRLTVLVTVLLIPGVSCSKAETGSVRPNVLVIVTDDQGYADLSAYPHSARDISTPNMDRIAHEGILFSRAYVTAPVCSPSRAGWQTGLYQQRWDPKPGWNPGLPEGVKTVAEYFKEAGYVTGKVGKSDFGTGYHRQDVREYPLSHGFDEFLGFSSHAHDFFLLSEEIERRTPDPHGNSAALGPLFENEGRRSYDSGYTTEIFTDWAIDFLEGHRQQPFFLNVAYNSVHHLIHEVPARYLEKFGAEPIPNYEPESMGSYRDYYNRFNQLGQITDREMRAYYLANLNCLDENVGRLLEALDRTGLAENTLVVFFSDNGGSPLTGANNHPLRGSKYTTFEGGLRVPFSMRWPVQLDAGITYPYRVSTLDVLPTCLEAAGIPFPESPLDGSSFLQAIKKGVPSAAHSQTLYWHFRNSWAVMDGDWKLIQSVDRPGRQPTSQILVGGDPAEEHPALFNIRIDPSEQNDMSRDHPDIVQRLMDLFGEWRKEMEQESQR